MPELNYPGQKVSIDLQFKELLENAKMLENVTEGPQRMAWGTVWMAWPDSNTQDITGANYKEVDLQIFGGRKAHY